MENKIHCRAGSEKVTYGIDNSEKLLFAEVPTIQNSVESYFLLSISIFREDINVLRRTPLKIVLNLGRAVDI